MGQNVNKTITKGTYAKALGGELHCSQTLPKEGIRSLGKAETSGMWGRGRSRGWAGREWVPRGGGTGCVPGTEEYLVRERKERAFQPVIMASLPSLSLLSMFVISWLQGTVSKSS